ncbi:MAG: hypothetical protein AB7H43_13455 [Acidimicrobiia bacterium]
MTVDRLAAAIANQGTPDGLDVKFRHGRVVSVTAANPPIPGLLEVDVAGVTVAGVKYLATGVALDVDDEVELLQIGGQTLLCLGRCA